MTTEERLENTREQPRQVKRRSWPLIVLGNVLLVVAALLFVVAVVTEEEVLLGGLILRAVVGAASPISAGAGVVCIVLGCIPFGSRLLATGILLLGLAAACVAFLATERYILSSEATVYGFVIAVTGLSGLVSVALGFVRLMSGRKGT